MKKWMLMMLAVLCTSCMAGEPYVELAGERFYVELAETQEKQALGMMFRDHLDDNRGMLFLFPHEAMRGFWMKNCRIPLDILYFNADLELVNVAENAQPCRTARCPTYPSEGPAKYVLELNGGKAAELGVTEGDKITFHLD